ncbi:MAG TPA: response regulator, partial [Longimicrobiales bacterium]|nr:response regulator [Longimicrobiales bacterium]
MNAGTGSGSQGPRVLVVDDDRAVAGIAARWLERTGFHADVVYSGEAALKRASSLSYDLVLSDIHMPGVSGLELARDLKTLDATIQVLIMTGNTELQPAIQALRLHADDYLVKPFDAASLVHSVRRAIDHRRLLLENRSYREGLEARVEEQGRRLEGLYLSGIQSLVRALEAKDPHTRGHSARVAAHAAAMAAVVPGADVEAARLGAQLHDIGKIGIRESILDKDGPLDSTEVAEVRAHPTIGEEILSPILK